MKRFILLTFILLVLNSPSHSSVDSLWGAYRTGKDRTEIIQLIFDAYQHLGNLPSRDSAFQYIMHNEFDEEYDLLNTIYTDYFNINKFSNKEFSIQQSTNWIKFNISNKHIENTLNAYNKQFEILLYFGEKELAAQSAEKASYYANLAENKTYKIISLLNTGKCFEWENKKNEAYRNYLDAYYYSLEIKNDDLIASSLNTISNFFQLSKIYEKAEKYKQKEIAHYIHNIHPLDSNVYFNLLSDLSDYYFDNNQIPDATSYSNLILDFCNRNANRVLLTNQLAIVRSYYFENNMFDDLLHLYFVKFPSELDSLKHSNLISYYRIVSLYHEREKNISTALTYIDSADALVQHTNLDHYVKCNFYTRKGEFLLRQKMYDSAIINFQKSFHYAQSVRYYPFLIRAATHLDTAYTRTGNYVLAHEFGGRILAYQDTLNKIINNDELIFLEVENVEKQKELFQKQIDFQIARTHNLQYMLMAILIAFSFLILLLAGSFKIHKFVIKAFGFFVFIFLFEFIILLADNKIHHLTHGVPLKIMSLKIILIAILFPLHHWVEEKVVHYLIHSRGIDNVKFRTILSNYYHSIVNSFAETKAILPKERTEQKTA